MLARVSVVVEFCHDCGVKQPFIWTADNDLWAVVMERTDGCGVVCPACFDKRAYRLGLWLRWRPEAEPGRRA